MSISELLAECERLDAEATLGPWLHRSIEGGWDGVMSEQGHWICSLRYNHPENATVIARSRTLLPLLVAVIKNQQRQIEVAEANIKDQIVRFRMEGFEVGESVMDYAIQQINMIAAELEDVKP